MTTTNNPTLEAISQMSIDTLRETAYSLIADNATLRTQLDALVTAGEKDGVLTMSTILARIQDYFNPEIPRELSEKHLKDVVGFGWKRHDALSAAVAAAKNHKEKEGKG